MQTVRLGDRTFERYISEPQILEAIQQLARRINADYQGRQPLLLPILNGSFMFASDLMKNLCIDCTLSFIKASSYSGTASTGKVTELIGLQESISGMDVLVIEDIVDTGHTLSRILPELSRKQPASLKVATLLHKPAAAQVDIRPDYVALEIPNDFIVGFGLDYNGLGRNLRDIYKVMP